MNAMMAAISCFSRWPTMERGMNLCSPAISVWPSLSSEMRIRWSRCSGISRRSGSLSRSPSWGSVGTCYPCSSCFTWGRTNCVVWQSCCRPSLLLIPWSSSVPSFWGPWGTWSETHTVGHSRSCTPPCRHSSTSSAWSTHGWLSSSPWIDTSPWATHSKLRVFVQWRRPTSRLLSSSSAPSYSAYHGSSSRPPSKQCLVFDNFSIELMYNNTLYHEGWHTMKLLAYLSYVTDIHQVEGVRPKLRTRIQLLVCCSARNCCTMFYPGVERYYFWYTMSKLKPTTSPLLYHYFTTTLSLLHHYFTTTLPLLNHYFTTTLPLINLNKLNHC